MNMRLHHCNFDLHFPSHSVSSMCLLALPISSLEKCQVLCDFFLIGFSLILSFSSSVYVLGVNPLSDIWFTNAFSHPVGCLFTLWILSFKHDLLNFVPLFQDCFGYLGSLRFHMNLKMRDFRMGFLLFLKKKHFYRDCFESVDLWLVLTFQQYYVFCSMNTQCVFIDLYLFFQPCLAVFIVQVFYLLS